MSEDYLEKLSQGPNQSLWADGYDFSAPPPEKNKPATNVSPAPAAVALLVALLVSITVLIAGLWAYDTVIAPQKIPPISLNGDGSLDIQALVEKAQPSVVTIRTEQAVSSGVSGGAGSGVIISKDGIVLTNAHVIKGATRATVILSDSSEWQARLVGSFPADDVAILEIIDPPNLTPALLGNSDTLRVGEPVIAIGNALNLGGTPTVTLGIVSGTNRSITVPAGDILNNLVQTDAAINPGNSGGPLLNAAGQVVAINTAIVSDAQSIGFAISINSIKPLIADIENGGGTVRPEQAFLGLLMENLDKVDDLTLQEFSVTTDTGVFVVDVVLDSASQKAGVLRGDVLVEVNNTPVSSPQDTAEVVRNLTPGDSVKLTVIRNDKTLTLTGTLTTREEATAS